MNPLLRLCWMLLAALLAGPAWAQGAKPNILVIWGDDIGQFNISAYNMGMMGYKTPNIDSIGKEGAVFTDWYGQQSCTAGRAAFAFDVLEDDGEVRLQLPELCRQGQGRLARIAQPGRALGAHAQVAVGDVVEQGGGHAVGLWR